MFPVHIKIFPVHINMFPVHIKIFPGHFLGHFPVHFPGRFPGQCSGQSVGSLSRPLFGLHYRLAGCALLESSGCTRHHPQARTRAISCQNVPRRAVGVDKPVCNRCDKFEPNHNEKIQVDMWPSAHLEGRADQDGLVRVGGWHGSSGRVRAGGEGLRGTCLENSESQELLESND